MRGYELDLILREYMRKFKSAMLAMLVVGPLSASATNILQSPASIEGLYLNANESAPAQVSEYVVGSSSSLPSGTLTRESGEVMTDSQKQRLQELLDAGLQDFLNVKVGVPANLNSGAKGASYTRFLVVDMPTTLPVDMTVEVAYQANSHHNDSDTSRLALTPMVGGETTGNIIYDTGYVNWKNYGGWFYMNTPYYTGEAVVPAGTEQMEFYSRCQRASNGGTYCTAGFGEVYIHFNKDMPAVGEVLQVNRY